MKTLDEHNKQKIKDLGEKCDVKCLRCKIELYFASKDFDEKWLYCKNCQGIGYKND